MQQLASDGHFSSLGALPDRRSRYQSVNSLPIRQLDGPVDLRYWEGMYSIDPERTQIRDDAIGWQRLGRPADGYVVIVGVAADFSLGTQLVCKDLPRRFTVRATKRRSSCSLDGGERRILAVEFWTDGENLGDISIYHGHARPQPRYITHDNRYTGAMRELADVLDAPTVESAIQTAMLMHQVVCGEYMRRLGAPGFFYNTQDTPEGTRRFLSPEPQQNDSYGIVPIMSTSPLRWTLSNISTAQVLGTIGARQMLNERNVRRVINHINPTLEARAAA